jgi:hypothetical protein
MRRIVLILPYFAGENFTYTLAFTEATIGLVLVALLRAEFERACDQLVDIRPGRKL